MSPFLRISSAVVFFSVAFTTSVGAHPKLDQFIAKESQSVSHSIKFVRINDGKILLEQDAERLLRPASVVKLITTAAVLALLKPSFRFSTKVYTSGTTKNGVVHGHLYVQGDGDPQFTSENLWQLAADLKNMGYREFSGDIVVDNSLFDNLIRNEARMESSDVANFAYDAPVTAFGVNFNSFAVTIAPGSRPGVPALVSADPYDVIGLDIKNEVLTSAPNRHPNLNVVRVSGKNGNTQIIVKGSIPSGGKLEKIYRSVNDPVYAAGEYVRAFLLQQGIVIRGKVRGDGTPRDAVLIAQSSSKPISEIVKGLNHFSNNYMADVLVKRLGAEFAPPGENPPGTYANGVAALQQFLTRNVGIMSKFVLEDGSGLSEEDKISAGQLTSLLMHMARQFELFPEFIASLPVAGQSGSLKDRFQSNQTAGLNGLVRAKTGTMSEPVSVSSLAGYVQHPAHGLVAFAIIQNGLSTIKAQPSIAELHKSQEIVLMGVTKYL